MGCFFRTYNYSKGIFSVLQYVRSKVTTKMGEEKAFLKFNESD